jgi:hypothetical protein
LPLPACWRLAYRRAKDLRGAAGRQRSGLLRTDEDGEAAGGLSIRHKWRDRLKHRLAVYAFRHGVAAGPAVARVARQVGACAAAAALPRLAPSPHRTGLSMAGRQ